MRLARALWAVAPGRHEIRAETLPDPVPGTCRVEALASGISRGTEAIVAAGRVPPSQHAAMAAPLMAGHFPFPVKYGYAAVGRTEARRVFVLHPHQDVFDAPAAMCIDIPDAVPTHRAVLAANMETALNVAWDAAPLMGERVTVIGAGIVGLLAASLLARTPAARVTLLDPLDRSALAAAFGCAFATPADAAPDQELIVEASGAESGLRLALSLAAPEARIVVASWFADTAPRLPLGEAFHSRRLRLLSSQVGQVAPCMRGRRSHAERLALALDLLHDPAYDRLIENPTPFETLPCRMKRLLAGGLCHVVTYGSSPCSA